MTHPLARKLEHYDPRGTVTVGWVLRQLREAERAGYRHEGRMVRLARALEVLYRPFEDDDRPKLARRLRRRAAKWANMQERGERPPVYVSRAGDAPTSDWLFDEEDCYRYRRAHGAVRAVSGPAEVPEDPDEMDARAGAIAEDYVARHFHGDAS